MMLSTGGEQRRDAALPDRRSLAYPDVAIPILRSGILARKFCQGVSFATLEAVFQRCVYLRSGDDFVCIGEPDIGNGPMTLIVNLGTLPALKSLTGHVASVN